MVTAPALDRTLILLAMAAMLVAAVALAQAFTSASFLFACVLLAGAAGSRGPAGRLLRQHLAGISHSHNDSPISQRLQLS
jgi:hypothetical protein